MGELVLRCQRRADMEGDDMIADGEWRSLISEVYGEMWSEVSLGSGQRYFETSTTITADGSASYNEPSDHFSTVRIARVADGREYPLHELQPGEEARAHSLIGTNAICFTHVDNQLYLYPAPSSGTYKWYYREQPSDLSGYADGQVVDLVSPAGEAFVIWGVAVLALGKGEKDVRLALQRQQAALERLQFEASQKSADPKSVHVATDDEDLFMLPTWDSQP